MITVSLGRNTSQPSAAKTLGASCLIKSGPFSDHPNAPRMFSSKSTVYGYVRVRTRIEVSVRTLIVDQLHVVGVLDSEGPSIHQDGI